MSPTGQLATLATPPGEASPDPGRWPPLLIKLRRTTRPDHARVVVFEGFAGRPGGWTEYQEFLTIHHRWIAALDGRLDEATGIHVLPLSGGRLPLLDRDLFEAAVPYAASTPRANILPVRSRAEALGYLYVREGFRLGCRVLARQARRLGIEPENGAALLAGLGSGAREAWLRLVAALGRVPLAEHAAVIESATELLHRWEDWLRSPQARVAQPQGASGVYQGA